jgi:hypothetical protein
MLLLLRLLALLLLGVAVQPASLFILIIES